MTDLPKAAAALLDRVRATRPRIHCLMNGVVPKFVADGLSALGAIPSMTSSVEEVADFVKKADALTINLGTLDAQRREAIRIAIAACTGKPWVLDPAHCDYSPSRARFAQDLLHQSPAALRANAAEFALLEVSPQTVAIETGKIDRVWRNHPSSDPSGHLLPQGEKGNRGFPALEPPSPPEGLRGGGAATNRSGGAIGAEEGMGVRGQAPSSAIQIANGHPLTAAVTGTGCLSGAITAAFLAVEPDTLVAAASATLVFGIAAELAARTARGPGSFEPALLDALWSLTESDILLTAKVTHARD